MNAKVTIVISPRDRFSGLADCIEGVYAHTDTALFKLIVLDLGYPARDLEPARAILANKPNATVLSLGLIIPIEGLRKVREVIDTPFVFFLDNDSRVTPGWLEPLLETGEATGAAIINPLTLEKSGVDIGAELRNHVYTTEIRVVDVDNKPYLIEHKTFRRALPEELPAGVVESHAFELHGVMFNTQALKNLELPKMTIREHLDIGMQLRAKGEKIVTDPRSVIHFDNLGTRAGLRDLRYFNLRWNGRITEYSSRLFEKRWGYNWYAEQSIYNWAIRRRIFMLLRWMHLPIALANFCDRIYRKIRSAVAPIWDPLDDPIGNSSLLYERFDTGKPPQLSHDTQLS